MPPDTLPCIPGVELCDLPLKDTHHSFPVGLSRFTSLLCPFNACRIDDIVPQVSDTAKVLVIQLDPYTHAQHAQHLSQ